MEPKNLFELADLAGRISNNIANAEQDIKTLREKLEIAQHILEAEIEELERVCLK